MDKKNGYITTTYKFRLYCEHIDWFYKTKLTYNRILYFYYEILLKEPDLFPESGRQLLRKLELLTIGARGQEVSQVKYPFPYKKIPLYFRRAAINDAIRLMKIYCSGKVQGAEPAGIFNTAPVYYKGMYKEFTNVSICLKLWNGEKWIWESCRLDTCGRTVPEGARRLSPVFKLNGRRIMLHVPVVEEVSDVRTVKERFLTEEKICTVAFPSNDCLAILAVINKKGESEETLFLRGGNRFAHDRRILVNRIRKNRDNMGDSLNSMPENENKRLKEKIRNLSEDYAHKVSREIVDFCLDRHIGIVVVPDYRYAMKLNQIGYLSADSYGWIGRRIISYLRYKAFQKGIMVTSVGTKETAGICYLCGEPVKRFNKNNKPGRNYYGGKNYICPSGHKGNAYFNQAMNIGQKFLKSQGEIQG